MNIIERYNNNKNFNYSDLKPSMRLLVIGYFDEKFSYLRSFKPGQKVKVSMIMPGKFACNGCKYNGLCITIKASGIETDFLCKYKATTLDGKVVTP